MAMTFNNNMKPQKQKSLNTKQDEERRAAPIVNVEESKSEMNARDSVSDRGNVFGN